MPFSRNHEAKLPNEAARCPDVVLIEQIIHCKLESSSKVMDWLDSTYQPQAHLFLHQLLT